MKTLSVLVWTEGLNASKWMPFQAKDFEDLKTSLPTGQVLGTFLKRALIKILVDFLDHESTTSFDLVQCLCYSVHKYTFPLEFPPANLLTEG